MDKQLKNEVTGITRESGLDLFDQMRKEAADAPEMTLDEINEEIKAVRSFPYLR